MNKNGFVQIITHQNEINEQSLKSLKNLGSKYPYSEVVHVMIAKGASIQNSGKPGKELTIAALYSTDRSILKSVLVAKPTTPAVSKPATEPSRKPVQKTVLAEKPKSAPLQNKPGQSKESKTIQPQQKQAVVKKTQPVRTPKTQVVSKQPQPAGPQKKQAVKATQTTKTKAPVKKAETWSSEAYIEHEKEMEALRNELIVNLKELKKSRDHLNEIIDHSDTSTKKTSKTSTSGKKKTAPKKAEKKPVRSSPRKSTSLKKDPPKSKPQEEPAKQEIKDTDLVSEETIDNNTVDALIENLETKRIEENEKNKNKSDQSDLSINSVEFGDDLVSENLAKIMIKQGKNEKAIDIYKKLIWKFPQKKAYFASQIEKLKEE